MALYRVTEGVQRSRTVGAMRGRLPLLAAAVGASVAVLVVVLVATGPIAEWLGGRDLAAATPPPAAPVDQSTGATPSGGPSAETGGVTAETPSAFPTTDESALIARLNIDAATCVRADA